MKPKTVVLSLPVADLGRSLAFYRDRLRLSPSEIDETMIAFELPNMSLFLIPTDEYATYTARAGLSTPVEPSAGACIISCAIGTATEVDEIVAAATSAGCRTTKVAGEDGSCTGYFVDPDGHVWELVYNSRTASAE